MTSFKLCTNISRSTIKTLQSEMRSFASWALVSWDIFFFILCAIIFFEFFCSCRNWESAGTFNYCQMKITKSNRIIVNTIILTLVQLQSWSKPSEFQRIELHNVIIVVVIRLCTFQSHSVKWLEIQLSIVSKITKNLFFHN